MARDPIPASDYYPLRAQEVESAADEANRKYGSYRTASVLLTLLLPFLLFAVFSSKSFPVWTFLIPVVGLEVTISRGRKYRRRVLKLLSVRESYDKGIARLQHDWDSLDDGKDFADGQHMHATDLDLFGRGSLFQLTCSARTHAGRETVATWMKHPATQTEVLARHAAISELRDRHDVRESVAAAGRSNVATLRPKTIRDWVGEMSSKNRLPRWIHPAAFGIVLVLAAIPFLYWTGLIGLEAVWSLIVGWLAVELVFGYPFTKRVQLITESSDSPSAELAIVADLLEVIEREHFTSPMLVGIADRVKQDKTPASREVRRVLRLIRLLRVRNNLIVLSLLLWSTQFATAIDRWHRRHGSELVKWLAAMGEFEAIVSLSGYSFEHPSDVFPQFEADGPCFSAEALGHPLLDEAVCVTNDVHLGRDAQFLIVSGSNMSGKSTFLRAIGANAALAWMGAPVRCSRLRISKLDVAATIRVQDSLADGQSHFFAEMQRLRRMIDAAGDSPVLFLVDEIMSGTNSKDRRIAAEWVIEALIRRGAIGLITTHDLTLTEIASDGVPGKNVYFEDSGEGGSLKFDYKLRSGLLTRSNALNIVRMLGIDTNT